MCVSDLIEEKWIFENKVSLILDILNRSDYVNPLKISRTQPRSKMDPGMRQIKTQTILKNKKSKHFDIAE